MILFQILFCLFLIFCLQRCLTWLYNQYRLYQALKNLPGPPIRFPLIGNLDILWALSGKRPVYKPFYDKLSQLCDQYGRESGYIRLLLGPFIPWIVICEPELAKKTLKAHADKASYYRLMGHSAPGPNLFAETAQEARSDRKQLNQFFTLRRLDCYIDNIERHLDAVVEQIEGCIENSNGIYQSVDILLSTFLYDTLGENLFSTNFNSISGRQQPAYSIAVHRTSDYQDLGLLQPWRYQFDNRILFLLINIFNGGLFSYTVPVFRAIVAFHRIVFDIVLKRYRQLVGQIEENNNVVATAASKAPISLLDTLLQTRIIQKNQNPLSKLFALFNVLTQADLFIIGGHDTSSVATSWMLHLLASHPEVQQKARDEVDRFLVELEQTGERPNTLNLKRLNYLECCLKETLRLYPLTPLLGRSNTTAPLVIDEQYILPPGLDLNIFYEYINKQEVFYSDAASFSPERFEKDGSNGSVNHDTFPFSFGERICLGKQYAISQIKLLFVRLLSKYEIVALGAAKEEVPHFMRDAAHFDVRFIRRR